MLLPLDFYANALRDSFIQPEMVEEAKFLQAARALQVVIHRPTSSSPLVLCLIASYFHEVANSC